jgi:hypothetical protein
MGTFLAQYVMTRLVDDLDGSEAVTTLSFSLDGHSYEIDLSESHLSALQQALAPFITAARAVPNARRAERAPASRTPATEPAATQPAAPKTTAPKTTAPKTAAPKTAAPKTAASKTPTPRRAPAPNGRAVPAPDVAATEAAPARPAAVDPAGGSAVSSAPFRQPSPGRASAEPARPKRGRAPLVADPFKPQS